MGYLDELVLVKIIGIRDTSSLVETVDQIIINRMRALVSIISQGERAKYVCEP